MNRNSDTGLTGRVAVSSLCLQDVDSVGGPFNVKKFSERSYNKKNISKKRRTRSFQSGCCPRQPLLAGVGVEGLRQKRNTRRIGVATERATKNTSGKGG